MLLPLVPSAMMPGGIMCAFISTSGGVKAKMSVSEDSRSALTEILNQTGGHYNGSSINEAAS